MNLPKHLLTLIRNGHSESRHSGFIAVCDHKGKLINKLGNPEIQVFMRSTAKPIQAVPVIENCSSTLSDEEVSVICSSHNGEAKHTKVVHQLLQKFAIDASSLQCGLQEPLYDEARLRLYEERQPITALHNTCSGKHAGMLILAKQLHAHIAEYPNLHHPVQQCMMNAISDFSTVPVADIGTAIDGCGVPVFRIPLVKIALAFARFGQPSLWEPQRAAAIARIHHSLSKHPFYLAGSDRFDTALIHATNGRIIGKMGAEGVFAITVPSEQIGIAIKIDDGTERALYPVVIETLLQLQLLLPNEETSLRQFHKPHVYNRRGEVVGLLEPEFTLESCIYS